MLTQAKPAMLDEWMAYYRIEPFGAARGDMQAGIICNHVIAAMGGDPGPVSDFILTFGEVPDPEAADFDKIEHQLMLYAKAHNDKISQEQIKNP